MGELNVKDFLILADQKPGEVTFSNFHELKEYLKNGLSVYSSTTYTADNLEEAINDRDQLKAIRKKLTDKKKEIENAYTLPYKDVKKMLDELIDMVKEPLNRADEIIKECERQKKRSEIIAFAKKEVSVLGEDAVSVLKSPAFYNSRWLNATYKMRDIEREIKAKVEEIRNSLELIRSLGGENVTVLLARYFETLSINGMNAFLQSLKQEKAKTSVEVTQNSELSSDRAMTSNIAISVLPTKVEIKQEEQAIVSKIYRLKGTEKNISNAISQVKVFGIEVEEIATERDASQTEVDAVQSKPSIQLNRATESKAYSAGKLLYESSGTKVVVGDTVTICDTSTGVAEIYTIKETYYKSKPTGFSRGYERGLIYSTEEDGDNDISKNEIRSESPLAKALLDKGVGYVFLWMNEDGEQVEYQITNITHRGE